MEEKKKRIEATIVADSKNEFGQRITTYVLTYPRMIHAEVMTHRMFSRNAASSRAIPAEKMIAAVKEDPFIPIAFQKVHKGMQGKYYLEGAELEESRRLWLATRNNSCLTAESMMKQGATKQLTNRLLEPFQWYTCLVTATEYENFFHLRCPKYKLFGQEYRSKKDALAHMEKFKHSLLGSDVSEIRNWTDLDWLKNNTSPAEIHIQALAESMWDARNESAPTTLKAGKWHIPFGDRIEDHRVPVPEFSTAPSEMTNMYNSMLQEYKIKIAIARCARVSYGNFEGKDDYEADIKLFERLQGPPLHASPFEHVAQCMSDWEYSRYTQTYPSSDETGGMWEEEEGWCGNFRGFLQYRKTMANENVTV
jgi:thymidylate synthase ThyX